MTNKAARQRQGRVALVPLTGLLAICCGAVVTIYVL